MLNSEGGKSQVETVMSSYSQIILVILAGLAISLLHSHSKGKGILFKQKLSFSETFHRVEKSQNYYSNYLTELFPNIFLPFPTQWCTLLGCKITLFTASQLIYFSMNTNCLCWWPRLACNKPTTAQLADQKSVGKYKVLKSYF